MPSDREYTPTVTSPEYVGFQGERLPSLLFHNPAILKEVNDWLERLDIGYQIKVQLMEPRMRDKFEAHLIDTRRKQPIEVSLLDIGFGVSQLLPFIVQSLASEGRIIAIEQPEIHVHPKLQADLGDLLAETIREPFENQFLIETHSEHLVLRLQKLVRQKTLTPEEVSILYVARGSEGSTVQRLRLDENGDFIDEWPGGFFPERLRELL
jgi:predicted ATPase